MSTIQEIEERINRMALPRRARQVIKQVRNQRGKPQGFSTRAEVRRRTYVLLRKFKHQYPRGTAFKRLQAIEADSYIAQLADKERHG